MDLHSFEGEFEFLKSRPIIWNAFVLGKVFSSPKTQKLGNPKSSYVTSDPIKFFATQN